MYYGGASAYGFVFGPAVDSTGSTPLLFLNSVGSGIGSISQNTSSVSYNTTSDYRLKDNVQPLTDSGTFIDGLRPVKWEWKSNGTEGIGFIAHEVQEVAKHTVRGVKDDMQSIGNVIDKDGSVIKENVVEGHADSNNGETWVATGEIPKHQSMEYGSPEFIAYMIAELQSLRKRVKELESKVLN